MKFLKVFKKSVQFLFRHKFKLVFILFFVFLFFLLRFPYNDLSGFVTEKVAKATKNKVYLQLGKMDLLFLPSFGLRFKDVTVNSVNFQKVRISELRAYLSLLNLILLKLTYQMEVKGLFGGELKLKVQSGESALSQDRSKKIKRQQVTFSFQKLNLNNLSSFISFPIKGQLKGGGALLLDRFLKVQPEGDLNVVLERFNLSNSSIRTPFGPMNLPEISFSDLVLKMNFSEGSFILEKLSFGSDQNPISGEVTGDIQLNFSYQRLGLKTSLGPYNLKVNLKLTELLKREFALILDILDKYREKSERGKKTGYKFQLKGNGTRKPPNLSRW